jgi:23S rRNA (adenine2503-C2)-methyltransferase
MMLHLQGLTPQALCAAIPDLRIEEARRVVGAVHRHDHLPASVRGVRRIALDQVRRAAALPSLTVRETRASRLDPFVKYSLEAPDGAVIETVRIPLEKPDRFSVCVSSQAGCGLRCAFCATGRLGLARNLETWEIVDQVRIVRRTLDRNSRQRVHGIVFQGMGEPLANFDNVVEAIRVAVEPSGPAIDGRAITVCTAGLPAGIRRLARELPKVRLAVSIASARPEVRASLMPIERAHPLTEVLEAAADHAVETGMAPMWAVTLLHRVNDSDEDARLLAGHAAEFRARTGLRPRISIIQYNPPGTPGPDVFTRSSDERDAAYRSVLSAHGFPSHRRYSGGADVEAACGQLAGTAGRAF